ncbi:copper amine oxidase domain protein [Alkaliphilus metalliredigens QYMF]|uniref:Copper amine oxidase domain protein n=1 Tax=Alkaliphilus metalliredigens (strain QYMF) TaxID=293826 RepID=A6TNC4_ALKMQ|nr:stalk domain-containing protein [Alkaliphilus metalliredigens]ABR47692.1 copper amine oxidase domain protein [Alkaliphilus metalliredigens QYMF]
MNKSKFTKTLALGICFTALSSSIVLANGGGMQSSILSDRLPADMIEVDWRQAMDMGKLPADLLDAPVSDFARQPRELNENILQKQREIDKYLFKDHVEEMNKKDFKVTHTGPYDDYVEIGITPYNEENATYLYDIFGEDEVKVVEGQQAVTLPMEVELDAIDIGAVKIQVNGQFLELDVEPFIENDRTLLPLRGVMEKLGAKVEWHPERKVIEVSTEDITIELVIGQDTAKIIRRNDDTLKEETLKLEVPATIKEDRTFIPGRFVTETLGAKVEWNESLRLMIVETDGESDIIGVERPIDFEIVENQVIEGNEAVSKWYQDKFDTQGIHSLIDGEWKYVLVSAGEKPTGGYSIQIDSITEVTQGTAYIHATLQSPNRDDMVTQALTYPNVLVRFHKGDIETIQGDLVSSQNDIGNIIENEIGDSLEEMQKAIAIDSIKEMKLYSLMGEEIKAFTMDEMKEIINQLNTSPTYNGAYPAMLAGNNIKMALEDEGSIQLISYGFEDHVILMGEVAGEYVSYCIVSPEIGRMLLSEVNR